MMCELKDLQLDALDDVHVRRDQLRRILRKYIKLNKDRAKLVDEIEDIARAIREVEEPVKKLLLQLGFTYVMDTIDEALQELEAERELRPPFSPIARPRP